MSEQHDAFATELEALLEKHGAAISISVGDHSGGTYVLINVRYKIEEQDQATGPYMLYKSLFHWADSGQPSPWSVAGLHPGIPRTYEGFIRSGTLLLNALRPERTDEEWDTLLNDLESRWGELTSKEKDQANLWLFEYPELQPLTDFVPRPGSNEPPAVVLSSWEGLPRVWPSVWCYRCHWCKALGVSAAPAQCPNCHRMLTEILPKDTPEDWMPEDGPPEPLPPGSPVPSLDNRE